MVDSDTVAALRRAVVNDRSLPLSIEVSEDKEDQQDSPKEGKTSGYKVGPGT